MHFHLPHQGQNEKIILLLRRHWFIMAEKILLWLAAAIVPSVLMIFLELQLTTDGGGTIAAPLIILALSAYYLLILAFALYNFVDYYLDVWVVTDERIVNIEQRGLFSRVISEQKLDRIQDVTAELQGILPTLFNYGTVYIQTAGEQVRFVFKQIPDPQGVAKKIIKIVDQNKHFHEVMAAKDGIHTRQS